MNNIRGPVVKNKALKNALQQNIIDGVILDVFEFLALAYLMVNLHIWGNANGVVLAMRGSAIRHLK
jgi:phosphoglycerate dehydrogenase-like enzyme